MTTKKRSLIHTPASMKNRVAGEQRPATVAETREWIVAGVLAGNQKVYTQLAEEHGRVFQAQSDAIDVVLSGLHRRLCILEDAQGIASPELESLRSVIDRIAEPHEEPPE